MTDVVAKYGLVRLRAIIENPRSASFALANIRKQERPLLLPRHVRSIPIRDAEERTLSSGN